MTLDAPKPWWQRPYRLVMFGFLAVAAFFLLTEHTAHAFGILPYLFLLACPLMHLFMHHGHGKHEGHKADRERASEPNRTESGQ